MIVIEIVILRAGFVKDLRALEEDADPAAAGAAAMEEIVGIVVLRVETWIDGQRCTPGAGWIQLQSLPAGRSLELAFLSMHSCCGARALVFAQSTTKLRESRRHG